MTLLREVLGCVGGAPVLIAFRCGLLLLLLVVAVVSLVHPLALRGPAVLRGYFFIYRVLSTSLLSGIKCTMWNYMTPPSSPHPPKNTPHPPFYGKKKVFFKNYLLLC